MVLPFWYWLTHVVQEKKPLNWFYVVIYNIALKDIDVL